MSQGSVEKAEETRRKKAEIGTKTRFLGGGIFDSFLRNRLIFAELI